VTELHLRELVIVDNADGEPE
jgi:hypothetical protein